MEIYVYFGCSLKNGGKNTQTASLFYRLLPEGKNKSTIEATVNPEFIPLLKAWQQIDYKKVQMALQDAIDYLGDKRISSF